MTYSTDILQQLRRDWDRECHSAESQVTYRQLHRSHPSLDLAGCTDMGDIVSLLEARSGRGVLEKAALVAAMLHEGERAFMRRALLQTLLPGIVSTCRQLRFGEGIIEDPSEVLGVAISLCVELLVDWAGQTRPYAAPDILSALRGRLRRWLLKEKDALRLTTNFDGLDATAHESSPLLNRLAALRGGPHDRMVRLTYARVFEGISLRELAAADHSSCATLRQELQIFALQQLL
jgi:hypothetical protein